MSDTRSLTPKKGLVEKQRTPFVSEKYWEVKRVYERPQERAWSNKEVAQRIGSGESTLRKWASALERAGYSFITETKGEMTSRIFTEHDILALTEFRSLIANKSETIESVAEQVVERYKERKETALVKGAIPAHVGIEQLKNEIAEGFRKQEEFNQELITRLEQRLSQQDTYIKESLERRDRELTQLIRGFLESASAEAQKKPWWKIWK